MATQKHQMEALSIERFTSSEAGAWSNAYLLSNETDAILFDVFMLREEAAELANTIEKTGKTLQAVMISHAHPDHFMGLDAIVERFHSARILSTPNVVADIEHDGPWILSLLQNKLGTLGPKRLVVPEPVTDLVLHLGDTRLEIVEFGECEAKHIAALHIPSMQVMLAADLVYNGAHLYVAEKHITSWLARLEDVVAFAQNRVTKIYPGHGSAGDLGLVEQTRAYLSDFAEAVQSGDANAAEQQLLTKYPQYHAKQFLTVFSIPAYFPVSAEAS